MPTQKASRQLDRDISSALEIKEPRLKFYGSIGDANIYLVSGEWVRNNRDLDFTAGGHYWAYPGYVPKREVWIDDAIHVFDRIATIYHEIVERNLMRYGGLDYDDAHDIALDRERKFRDRLQQIKPKTTDLNLVRKELEPYAHEARPSGKKAGKPSRTAAEQK